MWESSIVATKAMKPQKRLRTTGPETDEEMGGTGQDEAVSVGSIPSLQQMNEVFQDMIGMVETSGPIDADNAIKLQTGLLTLKTWQRSLFSALNESNQQLDKEKQMLERQDRSINAFNHELTHLEREIETCRTFKMIHLEKLAREEFADPNLTTHEVLSRFLLADPDDPALKHKIISRLHKELSDRGGLERDLKLKQSELEDVKEQLNNKKSFLDILPDHLATIERASLPLQKLITARNPNSIAARMTGTERLNRLELAKTLPAPLYVLFQQLQHYLDRGGKGSGSQLTLTVSAESEKNRQVVLQVPVPDISSTNGNARQRRVAIHFSFDPVEELVTAVASGCAGTLNQDILLDELFPSDLPGAIRDTPGRPYHWCNILAGIYVASSDCQRTSTRVVVRELQRRVRANATLKHLLHSLQRGHIPTAPDEDKLTARSEAKLVSFVLEKGVMPSSREQAFQVVVQSGEIEFKAKVRLHACRYPGIPPAWSLNLTEDTDPLYDGRLAQLEREVNLDILDRMARTGSESSCDWILVYQLREIMAKSGNSQDEGGIDFKRKRRGRDHTLVLHS